METEAKTRNNFTFTELALLYYLNLNFQNLWSEGYLEQKKKTLLRVLFGREIFTHLANPYMRVQLCLHFVYNCIFFFSPSLIRCPRAAFASLHTKDALIQTS